ncbi:MAG: hydantoinase B/oxoprolinase family protein [Deltaproteobacteria bacterium]|nr:hydantoinase B/oxoprolinase family protein [Deltaproteobacteria bacterium]MBW2018876.1 hydantoinase B/oxoprolinase family protein [Deltaproteobacteria bacterium]MBW2073631.1 hydantoinase B/oxoprolinase family protein [Deltaproteobacteria bacterium]RLB81941.1 MAG: hydantoinase B/oxoprolinase family protein [Deltaproteobacteria bacterium]
MAILDPITLEVFKHLILAIPEEMGANLRRSAFSPNIKERLDESCALFDAKGRLIAQAEHIPVHLGAMPSAVEAVITDFPRLSPGEQVIVNDPYRGGSHLPDITVIAPFFWEGKLKGYAVNRAHHADVGGKTPGSMPGSSRTLDEEGIIIPPTLFVRNGLIQKGVLRLFEKETRNPTERIGDLNAQVGANHLGVSRCLDFIRRYGEMAFDNFVEAMIDYAKSRVIAHLSGLPHGTAEATDYLDGESRPIPIKVKVQLEGKSLKVDFTGTASQCKGNANTPISVTRSAVYYVLRCLLPADIPLNHGCYEPVHVIAPKGSLLNPRPPAAVSSGNVETSQRIVDVLLLALQRLLPDRIPAQGQGTMNNLAIGWKEKTYYETIAGGMGGSPTCDGASAVQIHMTNTATTPTEVLESAYPVRVLKTALREGSGGAGAHPGGMGVIRELLLLEDAVISIQSERRRIRPKGIAGGGDARRGSNFLTHIEGTKVRLPGRTTFQASKGETIIINTPGGGGWGACA